VLLGVSNLISREFPTNYGNIIMSNNTELKLATLPKAIATAITDYVNADRKATNAEDTRASKLGTLCTVLITEYPNDTLSYLISPKTEGSLASVELYSDLLAIHETMLPDNIRKLAAIDIGTIAPKLPDGSPNPMKPAVTSAKKQSASKLADTREAITKRLKAIKRGEMTPAEIDTDDDIKALTRLRTTFATLGKQFEAIAKEAELAEGSKSYQTLGKVIAAMVIEPNH